MVPSKYSALGFEISKFGLHSKALRFHEKPIFIFNENSPIDDKLVTHICATYLKIAEKRGDLSCIKAI
jgi:hypothetical protein